MSHALDLSNGRANMAYVGKTPWHQLGNQLAEDATLEEWRVAAGFAWEALSKTLTYKATHAAGHEVDVDLQSHRALVRSDTETVLSVVSKDYKTVQPSEVLEFFRDLTDASGGKFKIETAGCLFDGKRIWMLASTPSSITVGKDDVILTYLLLGTSFDGSMSTFAMYTSVRVVCHNTLSMAVGANGERANIRIPHTQQFDPDTVKRALGLIEDAEESVIGGFAQTADDLAGRPVSDEEMFTYFAELYGPKREEGQEVTDLTVGDFTDSQTRNIGQLITLFKGGPGSQMESAKGTAWGLVNAVTHFEDHSRSGMNATRRLQSSGFGAGKDRKRLAVNGALGLVEQAAHTAAVEADGGDLLNGLLSRPLRAS